MTRLIFRYIHFILAMAILVAAFGLASSALAASVEPSISIASSGQTIVRGARVTSVSGNVVTARTTWGSSTLSWSIRTSGSTKFYPADAISSDTLRAIQLGDIVSFSGERGMTGAGASARAASLKDDSLLLSIQSVRGTITEMNAENGTAVFTTEDGPHTIATSRITLVTLNGDPIELEDLAIGDTVQVSGTRNTISNVIAADRIALDKGGTAVQEQGFFGNIFGWLMGARGDLSTR